MALPLTEEVRAIRDSGVKCPSEFSGVRRRQENV
jgi:hypothetical protein